MVINEITGETLDSVFDGVYDDIRSRRQSMIKQRIARQEMVEQIIESKVVQSRTTRKKKVYQWDDDKRQLRREYIIELIGLGYSKAEATKYLQARFGISRQIAYDWYNDATASLIEEYKDSNASIREQQQERLQGIIRDAMEVGNSKIALQAMEQLNKLNGLYTEKKEIVTDKPITFTFGG